MVEYYLVINVNDIYLYIRQMSCGYVLSERCQVEVIDKKCLEQRNYRIRGRWMVWEKGGMFVQWKQGFFFRMMSSILKIILGRGFFGFLKEFKVNFGYRILMVFGGGVGENRKGERKREI